MKQQFKNPLLCVFASMIFLFSCKKETVSVNENETVSAIAKKNEANKMVPFKGTYTTTVEVLTGPPMLLQRITGVGHATHLGASTFVALSTLNLTTAPHSTYRVQLFLLRQTGIFFIPHLQEQQLLIQMVQEQL